MEQLREFTTIRDEISNFMHSKISLLTNIGQKLVKQYDASCRYPLDEIVRRQTECLKVDVSSYYSYFYNHLF